MLMKLAIVQAQEDSRIQTIKKRLHSSAEQ